MRFQGPGLVLALAQKLGVPLFTLTHVFSNKSAIRVFLRGVGAALDIENDGGYMAARLVAHQRNGGGFLAPAVLDADLTAKTRGGKTALEIAQENGQENGHSKTVRVLEDIDITQSKAR